MTRNRKTTSMGKAAFASFVGRTCLSHFSEIRTEEWCRLLAAEAAVE